MDCGRCPLPDPTSLHLAFGGVELCGTSPATQSVVVYLELIFSQVGPFCRCGEKFLKMEEEFHRSVLLEKVIDFLQIRKGRVYVDATTGGAGIARAILKNGGYLLGIDCDPQAIRYSAEKLEKEFGPAVSKIEKEKKGEKQWKLVYGNFVDLRKILSQEGLDKIQGLIFDLGPSYYQLTSKDRGFSLFNNSQLDMRMDPRLSVKAFDLVNALTEKELYVLFSRVGEEQLAKPIAHTLTTTRRIKPIKTTGELSVLVDSVYRLYGRQTKWHPATKVFMALRMAVNNELESLKEGLLQSVPSLEKDGRLLIISFHSLEDRIVKNFFGEKELAGEIKIINQKPIQPSPAELENNPSSRSAKLRVAQKI